MPKDFVRPLTQSLASGVAESSVNQVATSCSMQLRLPGPVSWQQTAHHSDREAEPLGSSESRR
jgi:hypothetical protein